VRLLCHDRVVSGIEFLNEPVEDDARQARGVPGEPALAGAAPPALPAASRPAALLRTALGALLFLGAAVTTICAAASWLYSVGFGPGGRQYRYGVDAWGTYHGIGQAALQGERGPAYGWALTGCAVGFVAVAALFVCAELRLPVTRRVAAVLPYLAVAVTGVLGGVALAIYLDVSAVLAGTQARTRIGVAEGDGIRGDISTRFGAGPWLAAAGVVCAALGLAVGFVRIGGPRGRTRLLGRSPAG
jgi:hypothetical protein